MWADVVADVVKGVTISLVFESIKKSLKEE